MNVYQSFECLRRDSCGLWAERIVGELGFLLEHARVNGGRGLKELEAVIAGLLEVRKDGGITRGAVLDAESDLSFLSQEAKEYRVTCVAHAHIDMNWLWGYQETVTVVIDTFRTMLKLMEEYPEFIYSQSQAAVYEIIEKYCPDMLPEIKRRVHEGRWEVTASAWVEADKNLPDGESLLCHIFYTKQYLSNLLEIPPESMEVGFEPDTFGHSANLPEILQSGGVKYYYHCRGKNDEGLYRWKSPSGASVLCCRDTNWYHGGIEPDWLWDMPGYCKTAGVKQMMKVYGVGDHGGGPTRRDIGRILERQKWPLYPAVEFGRMHDFFREIEKMETEKEEFRLPEFTGELNPVFMGCYSSQARIKRANRLAEDRLIEAEALDAMAAALLSDYRTPVDFESAWRRVLFGQFHDILPGSGLAATREFALGEFQKTLAAANANVNHALHGICAAVNTARFAGEEKDGASETAGGAGAGYSAGDTAGYAFVQSGAEGGARRLFTVFNPTQYRRDGLAELLVWDWKADSGRLRAFDADGTDLPCEAVEEGAYYWGHHFTRVLVHMSLPPMGYRVIALEEVPAAGVECFFCKEPRVDEFPDAPIVLKNECITAVFSSKTMELLSLRRAEGGEGGSEEKELLPSGCAAGYFQYELESPVLGMTSWREGTITLERNLNRTGSVVITQRHAMGLRQWVRYTLPCGGSRLEVCVSLEAGSETLRWSVHADWHEIGSEKEGIPRVSFVLPAGAGAFRYAIPAGMIDRPAQEHAVSALGLACALREIPIALLSDCKYGFRGTRETLSVTLLRSSYDPDPRPEDGEHQMELGIYAGSAGAQDLYRAVTLFRSPAVSCATERQEGSLPEEFSLFQLEDAVLSSCRRKKDGQISLCMFNPGYEAKRIRFTGNGKPEAAGLSENTEEWSGKILEPQKIVRAVFLI